MFNDLNNWLNYLDNLHPKKIDFSLDRITKVANSLDLLKFKQKVVVVGGTNGKGTTCSLISSILSEYGYKVGLFTSPHISRFNERICLNNREVSDQLILDAFRIIDRKRNGVSLTYFEFTTLAALYIFKHSDIDFIILEIGLGGRLDAVNIVNRDVSIITSISIDHINYLGNTLDSIAFEKVHIFKNNCYAIYGEQQLHNSIKKYIDENEINFHAIGTEFKYQVKNNKMQWISGENKLEDLSLPTLPSNVACTLECIKALGLIDLVTSDKLNNIFDNFNLFGRFTVVKKQNPIIFDVAHNIQAIEKLRFNLCKINGDSIAIFAMCRDKDIYNVVKLLKNNFKKWYIVLFSSDHRMASQEDYNRIFFDLNIDNFFFIDSKSEIQELIENFQIGIKTVFFGSFRVVEFGKKTILKN